jgi:large-conductance mechanosensitive channel
LDREVLLIARFAFVVSLLTFILERTFKVIITQGSREIMNPVLMLWVISSAFAATYSDVNNLNKYLLSNYSRTLKPRINQDEQVFVNVDMILNSVIDFDVISGILSFVGLFSISLFEDQI